MKKTNMKCMSWQRGTSKSSKRHKWCNEYVHIWVCQALTPKNFNPQQQWFDNAIMQVLASLLLALIIAYCTFHLLDDS
jgi:hypothetical protein